MYKNYFLPVGLLAGTIIGAGIFSLPFVFKVAGFPIGFLYLALGATIYSFVHLMYADIVLRTPGTHRFVGYAEKYLGRGAFWFSIAATVVQAVLVMTIYLVLSESFANMLSGATMGFQKLALFWILGSVGIFLSVRRLAYLEFLITGGIVATIGVIFALGVARLPDLALDGINLNFTSLLLPLGPVLFALSGRVAIPSLVDYFRHPKDARGVGILRRVIISGTILPAVLYGGFVLGVATLSPNITPDAVSGLIGFVPQFVILGVGALGMLSLFSSYIVVGLDVYNILRYDLKFSWLLRVFMVIGGPMLIYISGFRNFINLVGFTGGMFLALEGALVVFMWLRANNVAEASSFIFKSRLKWASPLIILVFAAALLYAIMRV